MGYHKLPKIEEMVAHELRRHPETRNSDELLVAAIYEDYCGVRSEPYTYIMRNRHKLGLPQAESIGRCRRKLQAQHPEEFGATQAAQAYRSESELEYREYARR